MRKSLAVLAVVMAANGAAAQTADAQARLRSAVAIVVSRGVNESDSAPVEDQASGFFINAMGLLVTSYHLRSALGVTVKPESVAYEVHFDAFGPAVPAKFIYASPEADILVLYVPVGGRQIHSLQKADRNNSRIELAKTPVYAASFAAGYDFSVTPAVITAWTGPINPLIPAYTVNVNFAPGQSGSPVVLDDGRVIAVVKGADTGGAAIGYVVPTFFIPDQFWDSSGQVGAGLAALPSSSTAQTRVVVSTTVTNMEPRQVVRRVVLDRAVCDPSPQKRLRISAAAGATIDGSSIKLVMRSFSGRSVSSSVDAVTADGFDISAVMEPSGSCPSIMGGSLPLGSPARFEGEVRYLETPSTAVPRQVVIAESAALPGVRLPIGATGLGGLTFQVQSPSGVTTLRPSAGDVRTVRGRATLDIGRLVAEQARMTGASQ